MYNNQKASILSLYGPTGQSNGMFMSPMPDMGLGSGMAPNLYAAPQQNAAVPANNANYFGGFTSGTPQYGANQPNVNLNMNFQFSNMGGNSQYAAQMNMLGGNTQNTFSNPYGAGFNSNTYGGANMGFNYPNNQFAQPFPQNSTFGNSGFGQTSMQATNPARAFSTPNTQEMGASLL
jgi:hypothetical protein